jgi:hypothetical protein
MRKRTGTVVLLLAASSAAAETGGLEARAEQGRLNFVSAWYRPAPDWQGRWWWRDGAGSAWVRAGGFQTGPLIVTSGGDGWRRWYPGTTLSTGYWGAGWDGGPWGLWAVQRPDAFEAGAQLGAEVGPFSVGTGGDRTWSLEPPKPGVPAYTDRARAGLTWDDGTFAVGGEGTAVLDASGGRGWRARLHASLEAEGWYLSGRSDENRPPGATPVSTVSGVAGWQPLSLRWTRTNGVDLWEARWADDARWMGVTWGAELQTRSRQSLWSASGGVSAAGRWQKARWSGVWTAAPSEDGLVQTVTAAWREAGLEAEAVWRVEGRELGWFGPRGTMRLTVRRLF